MLADFYIHWLKSDTKLAVQKIYKLETFQLFKIFKVVRDFLYKTMTFSDLLQQKEWKQKIGDFTELYIFASSKLKIFQIGFLITTNITYNLNSCQHFKFRPKFQFFSKSSIFDQKVNVWPKVQFLTKSFIFDQKFNFWTKF